MGVIEGVEFLERLGVWGLEYRWRYCFRKRGGGGRVGVDVGGLRVWWWEMAELRRMVF